MKSFEPGFLEKQRISQNLLRTIRLIGEYKGKEEVFRLQSPQVLETLRQAAVIQSTESSNRIEGVVAPHERIVKLVQKKIKPANRSEQEIAGYRDVLNTIHANHANMKFSVNLVLQMHRDLLKFTSEKGGKWKSSQNEIEEVGADSEKFIRFTPVAPHLTEDAMRSLHNRFDEVCKTHQYEPLLLIPAYILDFLCIHPFRDGNGRMARLITLLLLYQWGFEVGRYISLEMIVEETKESYYDSLLDSSQQWHEGNHSLEPWWDYFVSVMLLKSYRDFEQRAGKLTSARGAKTANVLDAVDRLPDGFKIVDLERAAPNVTREMIRVVLNRLKKEKKVYCEGRGPAATWHKLA
ncbi:MAG: Fic family protein [Pyrinomonadaceae bacterium]|nr:Fic family protein [Pyrinomonadaceae bacterium]